jgi:opacity protein-like surface antigen
MVRATIFGLAGAAALLNSAALAADLPPPLPPPVYRAPPPVECCNSGWYLRGDVGVGMQQFSDFQFTQTNLATSGPWPATWRIDQKDIKDTAFVGFGIGYAWNNWARFDVTAEYRMSSKFKAVGSYVNFPNPALGRASDFYDGDHQATVFLANAYLDLGTWWCLTPFVGVGAGGVQHKTSALSDVGLNTNGLGASAWGVTAQDHTQWNFAWAVHAGLAYNVTNNLKLEFSYRYLNMGNVDTSEVLCGALGCAVPGGGPRAFYTMTHFWSNDFRIGMRWLLQPEAPPPPPLIRKG